MKLKDRINDRLSISSDWMLNSPESLVTLLLMASGLGSLLFSFLAIMFFISQEYFLGFLFGFFSYGAIAKLVSILRSIKMLGYKHALGDYTAMQLVWKKDKYGRRIDEYGNDGYCYETGNEGNTGTVGQVIEGLRSDNPEPERANSWTGFMLQRSDSPVQKTRHVRRRNTKTNN